MSKFSYRVVRTDFVISGKVESSYTIHRCIFAEKDDAVPHKYGIQEAAPEGDTLELLRADIWRMIDALEKPVYVQKKSGLVLEKK